VGLVRASGGAEASGHVSRAMGNEVPVDAISVMGDLDVTTMRRQERPAKSQLFTDAVKSRTIRASVVASALVAGFPALARADWTAHLDGGGGWSSATGGMGELTARADVLPRWLSTDNWGIGPAVELRLLHPGAAAGLVGHWRADQESGTTTTAVLGYDASDSAGVYVAGTFAIGLRLWERQDRWSPSTALYVAATRRLDGSDSQVVAGLQVGLGLSYLFMATVAR